MEAKAIWKTNMSFEGNAESGFSLPMGTSPEFGGDNDGFRPMELILIGLAGCTAMDVISILQKKRQEVTGLEVRAHADRATDHPKVFTHIILEYVVTGRGLDRAAVERAVELSETKYCPAQGMLVKSVKIESKITVLEAQVQ